MKQPSQRANGEIFNRRLFEGLNWQIIQFRRNRFYRVGDRRRPVGCNDFWRQGIGYDRCIGSRGNRVWRMRSHRGNGGNHRQCSLMVLVLGRVAFGRHAFVRRVGGNWSGRAKERQVKPARLRCFGAANQEQCRQPKPYETSMRHRSILQTKTCDDGCHTGC
jgi:hypothetical protein